MIKVNHKMIFSATTSMKPMESPTTVCNKLCTKNKYILTNTVLQLYRKIINYLCTKPSTLNSVEAELIKLLEIINIYCSANCFEAELLESLTELIETSPCYKDPNTPTKLTNYNATWQVVIHCCFSNMSHRLVRSDEMQEITEETMHASRMLRSCPELSMLFQAHVPCHWGSESSVEKGDKTVSPDVLVTSLIQKRPSRSSKDHDKVLMHKFLEISRCDGLVLNERKLSLNHVLPNRFSLLDCLIVRRQELDSWHIAEGNCDQAFAQFQEKRGVGWELLDDVTVKEIIIGRTPNHELEDTLGWALAQHRLDQLCCPVGVISMDIEEVRIRAEDYGRIIENCLTNFSKPIKITRWPKVGEASAQFPVKIMLGNGIDWALMISIPVIPVSRAEYEVADVRFPSPLVQFLKELPVMVGVGIRLDVLELVELVRKTSDVNFSMQGWVDLSTLAVLAGWNFPRFNMQAMSVQVLGGVMNKSVSRGDGEWGKCWDDIDDALKVYCLADVKFGFMTAHVLATLFLWDVFPDPDVTCSFTRKSPRDFAEMFFHWVFQSLVGTEVCPQELGTARNRSDLVNAIRTRDVDGNLSLGPPSRVEVFAKIFGTWPSIRFGGPRYLHQVRSHFVSQCQTLADSLSPHWSKIMPYDYRRREMWEAATYAVVPLSEEKWADPEQTRKLALVIHPDLLPQTLVCTGDQITMQLIDDTALKFGRNVREMLMEWIRMNLSALLPFFLRVEEDPRLSSFPGTYYVEGRMIFRRCTGLAAPRIASLDAARIKNARRDAQIQLEKLEKLQEARKVLDRAEEKRKLRLQFHLDILADDDNVVSTLSWRGQLPASRAESSNKGSRHDLLAVEFNKACDREEILRPADVDLVLSEELYERPHSEPCAKKRKKSKKSKSSSKRSKSSADAPTTSAIGHVRAVESSEDEVGTLQVYLDDREMEFFC